MSGLRDALTKGFGDAVLSFEGEGRDQAALVKPEAARDVLRALKDSGFNMLVDLTAVDFSRYGQDLPPGVTATNPAPEGSRFRLTYRLMKLGATEGLVLGRLAVHCWIVDDRGPASVKDLWPNADWLEREIWDMFGVKFSDRPGIKRLLLYEEFVGHPLRKDYPINKRQPLIGPKDERPRERLTGADLRPRIVP
ncbi:MAG: NADH-quinone oxidoreductase subunit C [Elusimicrobia bacterium]|nr:NADH-quinone oxidoreductase subunit C [Elusimicrobiota bacterium]